MSAASHYLYRLVPSRPDMISGGPTESEAKIIDRHFEYLQGLVRNAGLPSGSESILRKDF